MKFLGSSRRPIVDASVRPRASARGLPGSPNPNIPRLRFHRPALTATDDGRLRGWRMPLFGMCAITVGGPWEGPNHPPGNRTGSLTTATRRATKPCLAGPGCSAYNSIFPATSFRSAHSDHKSAAARRRAPPSSCAGRKPALHFRSTAVPAVEIVTGETPVLRE